MRLLRIIGKTIETIIVAILGLSTFLLIVTLLLYQMGWLEKNMPTVYCFFGNPKETTVKINSSTIAIVRYKQGCSCDTTFYTNININDSTTTQTK